MVLNKMADRPWHYDCIPVSVDFDNYMQHDAHEFLNFLINDIKETIISERTAQQQSGKSGGGKHNAAADKTDSGGGATGGAPTNSNSGHNHTWISDIFQGILTSETKCLNCETVSHCSLSLSFSAIMRCLHAR